MIRKQCDGCSDLIPIVGDPVCKVLECPVRKIKSCPMALKTEALVRELESKEA